MGTYSNMLSWKYLPTAMASGPPYTQASRSPLRSGVSMASGQMQFTVTPVRFRCWSLCENNLFVHRGVLKRVKPNYWLTKSDRTGPTPPTHRHTYARTHTPSKAALICLHRSASVLRIMA